MEIFSVKSHRQVKCKQLSSRVCKLKKKAFALQILRRRKSHFEEACNQLNDRKSLNLHGQESRPHTRTSFNESISPSVAVSLPNSGLQLPFIRKPGNVTRKCLHCSPRRSANLIPSRISDNFGSGQDRGRGRKLGRLGELFQCSVNRLGRIRDSWLDRARRRWKFLARCARGSKALSL